MRNKRILLLLLIPTLLLVSGLLTCCTETAKKGERLYADNCANCHGANGEGLAQLYPPLANADYLAEHAEQLPCIILNGLEGPIVVNGVGFNRKMEGHPELNDVQVANLSAYILERWAPKDMHKTGAEILELIQECDLGLPE